MRELVKDMRKFNELKDFRDKHLSFRDVERFRGLLRIFSD
jgi:hypothetical protein